MKKKLIHITSYLIIVSYAFVYFTSIISINIKTSEIEKIRPDSRLDNFLFKPKLTKNERKTSSTLTLLSLDVYKNNSGSKISLLVIQFLDKLKTKFLLHHQNISLLRAPPFSY